MIPNERRSSKILRVARTLRAPSLAVTTAALLAVGCGSDETPETPPGGDEYTFELFATTRVLDEGALASLSAYDDDGTLHFSATPTALAGIAARQVVIAAGSPANPSGFLRVVRSVAPEGSGLRISTGPAPIQLAFRKLHLEATRHIADIGAPEVDWNWAVSRPLATGSSWHGKSIDFYPVNGDGDDATTDDQVHVTGTLAGGFDYVFGFDVDWSDVYAVPDKVYDCLDNLFSGGGCSVLDLLPEAKVGYSVTGGASATLKMDGVNFLPYEAPYTVGTADLAPITSFAPLVFFPEITVTAVVGGEATSQFSVSASVDADFGAGVSFSSKNGPDVTPPDIHFDAQAPHISATLAADAHVAVGPELHLRLYDIAGPSAGLMATAALSADQAGDPCYELRAGLKPVFGFDIKTPELPVIGSVSLASWHSDIDPIDKVVDSGACAPLPGGGAPSPTGGPPDDASYAHPTFAPWSRAYAQAALAHPYGSTGALLAWIEAVPSIDGRFMVAGSSMADLVKLAPDGTPVWAKRYVGTEQNVDTGQAALLPGRLLDLGDATELAVMHPYTLMKLEADGTPLWAERFDAAYALGRFMLTSVARAPDGGFFVGGEIGDDPAYVDEVDAWLVRFDAHGALLWSRRWGEPDQGETLRSLLAIDGGVVAAGSAWDPATATSRSFTTRFDGSGAVVWSKRYDARECASSYEDSSFLDAGLVSSSGDLVFAGSIESAYDATLVLKLKPDGTLAWSASSRASAPVDVGPEIASIVELPTSGYLVAGSVGHSEDGTYSDAQTDLFLAATDSVGRVEWLHNYGGHRTEGGVVRRDEVRASVTLTRDGGAFIVGYTDSLTPDDGGVWAMKVAAKDGAIAFGASSAATSGTIAVEDAAKCVTQSDWPVAPTAASVPLHAIEVSVHAADVATSKQ